MFQVVSFVHHKTTLEILRDELKPAFRNFHFVQKSARIPFQHRQSFSYRRRNTRIDSLL